MKKRVLSMTLAFIMILSLGIPAMAATDTVTSASDSRVASMLAAIDNQNFNGSATSASRAKSEIKYFLNDCTFAVFNGGHFNYPNSGSYTYQINDGSRSLSIRGSTGCCAYSYYVSKTIYGTEANTNKLYLQTRTGAALKELLTLNAQAGEHLRSDNGPHSVAFISCDNNGFYCLSYCGDNNPVIHLDYWTFDAYVSYYNGSGSIYLYNANTAKNNIATEDWTPVISLSNGSYPTELKYGGSYNLEGIVSTNVGKLTRVRGFVTDYKGDVVLDAEVKPNTMNYNLNDGIDSALKFGSLKVGSYTYYLYAEAVNGKHTSSETLIEQRFNVVSSGTNLQAEQTLPCGYKVTLNGNAPYYTMLTSGTTAGTIKDTAVISDCLYKMNDGSYRFSVSYNGKTVYVFCAAENLRYETIHNYLPSSTTDPTCTRDGLATYKCACGQTKTESIPAVGHNMQVSSMSAPTCTKDGEIVYKCTVCGATQIDYTRTSGHFIGRDGYCVKCGEIPSNPFQDVKEGAAYYNAVLWAYYTNPQVVAGANKAGTLFNPTGSCTRAQVVTFLWRAAGSPEPATSGNPYKDVSSSAYYYKAILWAAENGITSGFSDGTFKPDQTVTRAQFVTFLWRFHGKEQPFSTLNPFVDVQETSNYYRAILWASETGVTSGYGNNDFRPDVVCNRWQVVTFIHRSMLVDM